MAKAHAIYPSDAGSASEVVHANPGPGCPCCKLWVSGGVRDERSHHLPESPACLCLTSDMLFLYIRRHRLPTTLGQCRLR